ncbi:MAG: FAD-dependent oxidoreductase [Candidatus Anammoxibacter sp.]
MIDKNKYSTSLEYPDIKRGEQCQDACPLGIDMPNYYKLMDQGHYEDAYLLLKDANPFPSITGRVCFNPCEDSCVRGKLDTPIAIREVEHYLTDYIQSGPHAKPELATYKKGSLKGTRKESVAIIGSGPAGMSAAWDLAHFGYKVTIYEKHPACGGMALLGIPVHKIRREVFDYEFEVLKKLGVMIVNNVEVGKDITIDELKKQGVSAICIAVGADVGKKLGIPGEEGCDSVIEATDVLRLVRLVRLGSKKKLGNNIIIIGGGNTAIDISRTCLRLGVENVTIAYRRKRENMPAYDHEIDAALKEGVKFQFQLPPKKVETKNGKLVGLRFSKKNGNAISSTETDILMPADTIILAISQKPNLALLRDKQSLAISDNGLIKQEMEKGIQNLPGIFAAGDAITGPRSIVYASASGRKAARHIDSYLRKVDPPQEKIYPVVSSMNSPATFKFDELKRQQAHKKVPLEIEGNFDVLAEKFTAKQAKEEADRCFRCSQNIEIDSSGCINCNYCVDVCPVDCLVMVNENNKIFSHESELKKDEFGTAVMIKDALCIRCALCVKICPAYVISFKSCEVTEKSYK